MTEESPKHRRSIRLPAYDYAQAGAYFVTIGVADRKCVFGEIQTGAMTLSPAGRIAEECWLAIPDHFSSTLLGEFCIMPNHMHGVILIQSALPRELRGEADAKTRPAGPRRQSLGAIIGSFKSSVSKLINAASENPTAFHWQRNYYEHIIRNEVALQQINEYINTNPLRWELDELYPSEKPM